MRFVIVDSKEAWLVTMGSFIIHATMLGFIKTYSLIIIEYKELLNAPDAILILSSTLITSLIGLLSPLSNYLANRFTTEKCGYVASIIGSLSVILMAYAYNPIVLIISAVMIGISFSIIYIPSVPIIGKCHIKRQNYSQGIILSGSPVGSVVMQLGFSQLISIYSIRGFMLIMSGIFLHFTVSSVLMPIYIIQIKDGYKPILIASENNSEFGRKEFVEIGNWKISSKNFIKNSKLKFPPRDLWCSLILYSVGLGCVMTGYIILTGLYGLFAKSLSFNISISAYILTALSCIDLLTRLIVGYFVDLIPISRWVLYVINALVLCVVTVSVGLFPSVPLFYLYIVCHGIFGSMLMIQFFVVLLDLVGADYINTSFSIYTIIQGSMSIIFGYITGHICDITDTPNYGIIFAGLLIGFGGLLIIIDRLMRKC